MRLFTFRQPHKKTSKRVNVNKTMPFTVVGGIEGVPTVKRGGFIFYEFMTFF